MSLRALNVASQKLWKNIDSRMKLCLCFNYYYNNNPFELSMIIIDLIIYSMNLKPCYTTSWAGTPGLVLIRQHVITLDLLNVWKYPVLVGKAELSSLCFHIFLVRFPCTENSIFNFHCSIDAFLFFSIISILRVSCAQNIKSASPFVEAIYKPGQMRFLSPWICWMCESIQSL